MKSTTFNTVNIGPGVLEDLITRTLKEAGHIPKDAISPILDFQHKNTFRKQVKTHVNVAKVSFKVPIDI
jgi:hypothetical protein